MFFSTDGFQARFPGLYAIYTETPERRRVNGEHSSSRLLSFSFFDRFRRHESSAMFAIVLICLFLAIVHFMTTTVMLYGVAKVSVFVSNFRNRPYKKYANFRDPILYIFVST